mmetsp:Transcript_17974/g.51125  ORF Transcript_17974/g.51125 Transcript_17974/m.51125 type:complete len:237 (+) Transcript_17974:1738-2448(+)
MKLHAYSLVSNSVSSNHACVPSSRTTSSTLDSPSSVAQMISLLKRPRRNCDGSEGPVVRHLPRWAHRCRSSRTGGKPTMGSPFMGTRQSLVPCTPRTATLRPARAAKSLSHESNPPPMGSKATTPATDTTPLTSVGLSHAYASAIMAPFEKPARRIDWLTHCWFLCWRYPLTLDTTLSIKLTSSTPLNVQQLPAFHAASPSHPGSPCGHTSTTPSLSAYSLNAVHAQKLSALSPRP